MATAPPEIAAPTTRCPRVPVRRVHARRRCAKAPARRHRDGAAFPSIRCARLLDRAPRAPSPKERAHRRDLVGRRRHGRQLDACNLRRAPRARRRAGASEIHRDRAAARLPFHRHRANRRSRAQCRADYARTGRGAGHLTGRGAIVTAAQADSFGMDRGRRSRLRGPYRALALLASRRRPRSTSPHGRYGCRSHRRPRRASRPAACCRRMAATSRSSHATTWPARTRCGCVRCSRAR